MGGGGVCECVCESVWVCLRVYVGGGWCVRSCMLEGVCVWEGSVCGRGVCVCMYLYSRCLSVLHYAQVNYLSTLSYTASHHTSPKHTTQRLRHTTPSLSIIPIIHHYILLFLFRVIVCSPQDKERTLKKQCRTSWVRTHMLHCTYTLFFL